MSDTPENNEAPPTASEGPSLNDRIADIVLKVLMTGGITVGSAGAVWSLVKDSDIPKAIASAVIGLGISYAAKMLQPIHQGNQRRLERAGQAVDQAIEQVTDRAIRAATGFEDKYLLCQASDCESFRTEGGAYHDRIFTPLLKEVFVPLRLDASPLSPGFRSAMFEQLEATTSIWKILARSRQEPMFRQLAILAWGGYGKTTLLKHIAYLYGTKQQPSAVPKLIPILLVLRKYRDLLAQDHPPTLPELITTHHIPNLPGAVDLQVPPTWAKDILKQGRAIVMLDGFDEVAIHQRPAVTRWITNQLRQYGKSTFILTSRPKAYREQAPADRLEMTTAFWVKDFDATQRKDFVEKWYLSQERYAHGGRDTPEVEHIAKQAATDLLNQIEARQELKDLAKNPLLLNMIVTFHRRFPGAELPKRRVELYREICLL